ncbi:lipid-A-disaccharide synthase [Fibrella aquatilis]|uniref:Lipid-A-disaccharide synthase n=1 Tax=Fibrella aquatilis TaxID=2817059 RepID=A0A939K227_9BACT|nr:lipid-A-disaccharide synthase [Fibrella aquatilis]MBO0933671.1 lipid-A-disaccharide synthase [Fibrella aquatilis]
MTYYLIAGERSGDLHGANLMGGIRANDPAARFRAWGGEQMAAAGADVVRHYRDLAFMGFWEVVKNLGTIRRYLRECQADVAAYQPDVLILIDYAGFNLRMAKWAKKRGIRVFYYISPKVWAWNQRRALTIKANVDRLFVILPFEKTFFERYDYTVDYVGNPLLDALAQHRPDERIRFQLAQFRGAKQLVALLPGSRRQEITAMLPVMLETTRQFPDYRFVVGTVDNLPTDLYDELMADYPEVGRVANAAYDLLAVSTAALVTSGTATLETALLRVPQVVCYRTSAVNYAIAKRVIAVPYLSLVNLIMDQPLVTELIQKTLNTSQLANELSAILPGGTRREAVMTGYDELQRRMGEPGASARAGAAMVNALCSMQ